MRGSARKFKPFLWLLLTLAVLAAGTGVARWLSQRAAAPLDYHVYDPPLALPAFALRDGSERPFDGARLAGRWTFVFFGYTHCPDVCPNAMILLKQLRARLGDDAQVQYLLVSVDPERDSPARLREYVRYFDPSFLAATGPHAELARLTRALGVYYAPAPGAGDDYAVDHSSAIYLIGPEVQARAVFTAPQDPERMAQALRRLRAS